MQLGNVRLEVVSDGSFWLDAGGHFGLLPKVMWEKVARVDEQNRVELALNCLYSRHLLTGFSNPAIMFFKLP